MPSRAIISEAAFASEFTIDVVLAGTKQFARVDDDLHIIKEPSYLHANYRSYSLGHLFRDNFPTIIGNIQDLGIQQYTLQLVKFCELEADVHTIQAMYNKYAKLVAPTSAEWSTLVSKAKGQFILLKDVVVGSLLLKFHPTRLTVNRSEYPKNMTRSNMPRARFGGKRWHKHSLFNLVRDVAYISLGVGPARDVQTQRPLKVLFGEKSTTDKRRIANIPALLPGLRERFRDATIQSTELHQLSASEQIQELSTTSIFISPVSCSI